MNNFAFLLADTNQRSKEAVDLAAVANCMAPNNPDFADTLGYAYWRHGQHRAELDVFSRLTQSRPEPIFNYHYALELLSSGRTSQARMILETALRRNPEPKLKKKILESLART